MATSGKVTTSTVDSTYFWVKWSVKSQSIDNNKTVINWSCGVDPGHQYYTNAIKMGAVTINGTKVYDGGTYSDITDYKEHTFASGTLEIAHDSDGSKTFTVAAFTGQVYDGSGGYLTASAAAQSFALTTIPRASSVATSGSTLGSVVKITITRASTAFTHKLYYTCGSLKNQSIAADVATSYDWTPPVSLAQQAPNATTVAATLTVETYNGGTKIGTTTAQLALAVPSSVVPTLTVALSDPTGVSATYGGYVQLRSRVKVVITASGAQGSTIKAYSIKAGSFYAATTASGTTGFLPNSGTVAVTCKVTDSRGRTASKTQNITVLAYSKPAISAISAARCNEDGTANRAGLYGKVTFSAAITSLSEKNTAAYTAQYREVGATTWASAGSAAAGDYAPKNVSVVFSADQSTRYEVRVLATDAFEGIGSSIRDLPASFLLMHHAKSMLSIGIGRLCDKAKALQVGIQAHFDDKVHMYNQMAVHDSAGNPYVQLDDGENNWFLQVLKSSGKIAIGSTWAKSVKVDTNGNLDGKYLVGTWLQTTATTDLGKTAGKVAVLDDTGWVYYRTPAELKTDMGVVTPADYVVEQGTSGSWRYQKWNSGIIKAWRKTTSTNLGATGQVNSWYYRSYSVTIPSGLLTSVTSAMCNCKWGTGVSFASAQEVTTTSFGAVYFSNQNGGAGTFYHEVTGTWK